jgi:hypothetical protein
VSRFISQLTVPVQFNVKEDVGAQSRYHAQWTPAIIYQDVDGNEFRRSLGSLNPDQLIAELSLACALRFYHSKQFDKSAELLEQALEYTRTDPMRHAENLYWIGPAKYEGSGTGDDLMAGFKTLQDTYPESDWAKKSKQLKID